jgi:hypothetical protein
VPTPTATPTIVAPTATIATPTPTPGCADDHGPSAFPGTPVDVSGDCPGGVCTDDGYDLTILGTIDVPGDTDFYVLDVVDLVGHSFALQAKLSDIPDDTNYDLFLYRFVGGQYVLLESSTHNGTGSESVEHSVGDNRQAGRYGVEVRGVSGASCGQYRLEIEDPN